MLVTVVRPVPTNPEIEDEIFSIQPHLVDA
jgi:hypothetical protein